MAGVDVAQIIVSLLMGVAAGIIAGVIVRRLTNKPVIFALGVAAVFFIIGVGVTAYSYQSVVLREIPALTGLSKDEAELRLHEKELIPVFTEQYSDTVDKGRVISQDLSPGLLVERGSEVQFVVSKGPCPLEAYMVYSDIGIVGGDVWVWSGADWGKEPPLLVDGNYVATDPPEGTTCFAVTSGFGPGNYVGWGVFVGIFEDHKLITPHIVDLSDYEKLEFWVRTSVNLKVEIQQDNAEGAKSAPCLISNYGWSSSLPDVWQKVTIPKSALRNVDLTKIFCPFLITGTGSEITFYVDEVMWVP